LGFISHFANCNFTCVHVVVSLYTIPVISCYLIPLMNYRRLRKIVCNGCYCHIQHRACRLPVLQVGGHSSLSNGRDTYRRAGPCAGCAHRGAGWAWRDMQMDVSCSWGFERPGIDYIVSTKVRCLCRVRRRYDDADGATVESQLSGTVRACAPLPLDHTRRADAEDQSELHRPRHPAATHLRTSDALRRRPRHGTRSQENTKS